MKKSIVIYMHLLLWGIIITSVYVTPMISVSLLPEQNFLNLSYWLLLPLTFYVGYLGIMRVESKKKFFLLSTIVIISSYPVVYFLSEDLFVFISAPQFSLLFFLTIGCLFGFFVDWYHKKKDIMALEKENLSSNLAMLKFQINPHFLFNTLHNIDALIYENQDKASKSLTTLSDMMRYMLHDTKPEFVELEQEINHLKDYMSLERIRLKNEKFLNFSVEGDYQDLRIAPMLLIPFVENAFKHAVDSTIENGISIAIEINNGSLNFKCENYFDPADASKDETHGIGLKTVKKRLELIYPNKHDLSIKTNDNIYNVSLKLNLNEH